uniref:Transposase DDE domain group 1 n=1 Tax=Candidatus Kentrum sp. DK TaxID=2126562 RepID=A0A450S0Q6_9GAMM|nr:MAG: Transposase DDE domain group 1 [Candidatus Kentron sp. DK]
MKKNTRSKARVRARNVHIQSTGRGLTSQAGLIPVVKFLKKMGLPDALDNFVPHRRGNNAVYQLSDVTYLTVLGLIAGASSLLKVVAVWSDGVLRGAAGCIRIPDDTTLGRIFKEVSPGQISLMETLQHRLRSTVWCYVSPS